ncbi:Gti1/Pac2 family-domain-containing protein [Astrocystis sublimbata]|nr:Gti1/Pac2 family-domain-containing protein [Astrocystis sublimbata]
MSHIASEVRPPCEVRPNCEVRPTCRGFVSSSVDALCCFQAVISGRATHIARRPQDKERPNLIKSGNVFIYEKHASGIDRWTDGKIWSPSRILGNFLLYRELDEPFAPGEPKRALKRRKTTTHGEIERQPEQALQEAQGAGSSTMAQLHREDTRHLIGSLEQSYPFKKNGLVKKTITVCYNGLKHHLVSYYTVEDMMEARIPSVRADEAILGMWPTQQLMRQAGLRGLIEETLYQVLDAPPAPPAPGGAPSYGMQPPPPPPSASSWPPMPGSDVPHYGYPQHGYAQHEYSQHGYSQPPAPASYQPQPQLPSTGPEYQADYMQSGPEPNYGHVDQSYMVARSQEFHYVPQHPAVHGSGMGFFNYTPNMPHQSQYLAMENGSRFSPHNVREPSSTNVNTYGVSAAAIAENPHSITHGADDVDVIKQEDFNGMDNDDDDDDDDDDNNNNNNNTNTMVPHANHGAMPHFGPSYNYQSTFDFDNNVNGGYDEPPMQPPHTDIHRPAGGGNGFWGAQ